MPLSSEPRSQKQRGFPAPPLSGPGSSGGGKDPWVLRGLPSPGACPPTAPGRALPESLSPVPARYTPPHPGCSLVSNPRDWRPRPNAPTCPQGSFPEHPLCKMLTALSHNFSQGLSSSPPLEVKQWVQVRKEARGRRDSKLPLTSPGLPAAPQDPVRLAGQPTFALNSNCNAGIYSFWVAAPCK